MPLFVGYKQRHFLTLFLRHSAVVRGDTNNLILRPTNRRLRVALLLHRIQPAATLLLLENLKLCWFFWLLREGVIAGINIRNFIEWV